MVQTYSTCDAVVVSVRVPRADSVESIDSVKDSVDSIDSIVDSVKDWVDSVIDSIGSAVESVSVWSFSGPE